jgi:TRAP-type C4-dicarboxylate transport system permease small subunit
MNIVKRVAGNISEIGAWVAVLAIFIMLFLTVGDVVGRYFFNRPISGTFEITRLLFAISVFFAFAVSQFKKENLFITLLYSKFNLKIQGILDLFSAVIGIGMFSLAFWHTLKYALRIQSVGQFTSVLRWPIHPWIYLAAAGMLFLVIALLWDLVLSIKKLRGEEVDES